MAFKLTANRRSTNRGNRRAVETENDEFEGLWINVGPVIKDEETGEDRFSRLPRGIAVSDLVNHAVYKNTNPVWAKEANLLNQIMNAIRKKGLTLDEGEGTTLNLSVQLYRRQEQVESSEVTESSIDDEDLEDSLFS